MLAAAGFLVQEKFHPLFSGDGGPAIEQIPKLPVFMWFAMTLGIGICEAYRVQVRLLPCRLRSAAVQACAPTPPRACMSAGRLVQPQRARPRLPEAEAHLRARGHRARAPHQPCRPPSPRHIQRPSPPPFYRWDPLGLKPTDPEEFKVMQTKELQNGRLAMLAAAGFMAQEAVTGDTWGAYWVRKRGGASLLPQR